jgi:predicted TIM-barrel fold metal-dependent hydrolase
MAGKETIAEPCQQNSRVLMKSSAIPLSQKARPKKIIDVHAHVGISKVYQWLGCRELGPVMERSHNAGIDWCIVSHLDALYESETKGFKANSQLLRAVERQPAAFMWWVYDPRRRDNLRIVREFQNHPKIIGLKIGPTYHQYFFSDYADVILELAEETGLAVLSHSGEERDMPSAIMHELERFKKVRFIVAHYGNCGGFQGHYQALAKCQSKNCFVDTSSAVSMYCDHIEQGVRKFGSGRFMFGTDTPLYSAAAQMARIIYSPLNDAQKRAVLGDNALDVLFRGTVAQRAPVPRQPDAPLKRHQVRNGRNKRMNL